jgi:hypothetical protein
MRRGTTVLLVVIVMLIIAWVLAGFWLRMCAT